MKIIDREIRFRNWNIDNHYNKFIISVIAKEI